MPNNSKPQQSSLIDESLEESFPASDSPAWAVVHKHVKETNPENIEHKIQTEWNRSTQDFNYETYNRDAHVTFAGGDRLEVSNPEVFGGDSRYVNSEELLVASLSFCYMQTFLAIASKNGYKIKRYVDDATGKLGKNGHGTMRMASIKLNPKVQFESAIDNEKLNRLKESAHHHCFIANSLASEISITIELL